MVTEKQTCGCVSSRSARFGDRRLPSVISSDMMFTVLRQTHLEAADVNSLYSRFRRLVPSGQMSFSKFRNIMGMLGMLDDLFLPYRMFCAFDANEDDNLDFVEFATAVGTMICGEDDEKLELAFKILSPLKSARKQKRNLEGSNDDDNRDEGRCSPTRRSRLGVKGVSSTTTVGADEDETYNLADGSTPHPDCRAEDGLTLPEFQCVVESLASTRRQLIGSNGDDEIDLWTVEHVFRSVSSTQPDGTPYMSLNDFKKAVRTNVDFLSVLGIFPGAQDRHLNAATRNYGKALSRPKVCVTNPSLDLGTYLDIKRNQDAFKDGANIPCNVDSTPREFECQQQDPKRASDSLFIPTEAQNNETTTCALPCAAPATPLSINDLNSLGGTTPSHQDLSPTTQFIIDRIRREEQRDNNGDVSNRDQASRFSLPSNSSTSSPRPIDPNQPSSVLPVSIAPPKFVSDVACNQESHSPGPPSPKTKVKDVGDGPNVAVELNKTSTEPTRPKVFFDFVEFSYRDEDEEPEGSSNKVGSAQSPTASPMASRDQPPTTTTQGLDSQQKREGKSTTRVTLPERIRDESRRADSEQQQRSADVLSRKNVEDSSVNSKPFHVDADGGKQTGGFETPIEQHLAVAENRLKEIIERIDSVLADEKVPLHSDPGGSTQSLIEHPSIAYRKSSGASEAAGRLARTVTIVEVQPKMFMNKPNFEESRSRRQGSLAQLQHRMQKRRAEYKLLGPQKGFAVHFGHPSWNMVLNMMVGVRLAAGRINSEARRKVEAYDFIMKEKISILPQSTSLVDTDTVKPNIEIVRFIDYAPMVFRKIRELYGITADSYLQSVGPEQLVGNMVLGNLSSLSELCSEGKSGAFFYYTADGRFLVKTLTRDSAKFFRVILRDYFNHIVANPDTLIARFYGLHAIRIKNESGNVGTKLYFIVMGNWFHSPVEIHRRYDLKGSWIGRHSEPNARLDPTIILKDLDLVQLNDKISVGPEKKEALIDALQKDAQFFEKHLILDYSLLVGIHFKLESVGEASDELATASQTPASPQALTFERRPFFQRDLGGMASPDGKVYYYMGIIDVLTKWTTFKRLERDCKAMQFGRGVAGISCVHPAIYAHRFIEFLKSQIE